ncbi:hypothetical protein LSTR_LSTR010093 [Laodelphax striatellus]|uniref:L-type lectin-like domain-containing protein n=1 Tax=Laodelphax striatellus TaxID=195883 RepID=A0A482X4E5_LAOST|nr:hypothetical protein LSTR_LSTR010093 [Laodelphax striatellus]
MVNSIMAAEVRWLYVCIFLLKILYSFGSVPHRRFEYKYSFKPPYLAQKDGSIPFWETGGNLAASDVSVRLASSMRSQKGAMWSKMKTTFDWWEVDIIFRITGRGRIGADGLAFWYTEDKGDYNGEVFGSSDKWKGLGIFFDSFDNDNKHNNPYIMGVVNDGTMAFDHANDGSSQQLAGCLRDFRNKPFPTRARIEYYMNTLTVLFLGGTTNSEQDFEVCFRKENVYLPKEGHFGLSAATGGLADDHDVIHFLTTSLYPPGTPLPQQGGGPRVSVEEQQKLSQEYADYQRKLDQQKEEYRKEHPESATKDPESEFEDWYESDSQRELRQIFSGQSQMFEQVRALSQKLDEVIGRQERTLSMLSSIPTGGAVVQQGSGQPVQMVDTIRRHEVDAVINNQNSIIGLSKEIRNYIVDVHSRTDNILQNQARAPTAQVQSVGYDMVSLVNELRDGLNSIKREAAANPQAQVDCAAPNCVSPVVLVAVAIFQVAVILLYSIYKDNKEAQAKKFY